MTVDDEQIEALRDEAVAAGDNEMADLCRVALGSGCLPTWTRGMARAACARAIADAAAQDDSPEEGDDDE